MSREWKPGDVALIRPAGNPRAQCIALFAEGEWQCSHRSGSAATVVRPLVVIDPEDREQVERLVRPWMGQGANDGDVSDFQQILREFANPKPPKPDEPTGLGAVVEDTDGHLWIRTCQPCDDCLNKPWQTGPVRSNWLIVDAVRVLNEGVALDAS